MGNALIVRKSFLPKSTLAVRAAQYVRMSRDKQRYSIANQAAVIAAYAAARNLEIVRTYADEGETGLLIKNRAGLQRLIADVTSGKADFSHVLVYDVSRWGRFQDTDESAHYEFLCKEAGVKVAYCAEQFENDGSMISGMAKHMKRAMAAEWSRELSVRIHLAQCRIVRLGFRHGAPITYGLRRELVDEQQHSRGFLRKGEVKYLQTDRVKLRPGSSNELSTVKLIFQQCLKGKTDTQIAADLNRKEVPSTTGHPWNRAIVSRMLRNENYIGNIVYNRQSKKLKGPKVNNPCDQWVRCERCLEPMVEPEMFQRVKKRLDGRRVEISEGEMLSRLRRALHKHGRLSPTIIDNTSGLPCQHVYIRHFGSIRNTYRLIGYTSERDYTFIDAKENWAEVTSDLALQVSACLEKLVHHVLVGGRNDELLVDRINLLVFRVGRAHPEEGRFTQWRVPRVSRPISRWIVVIRATDDAKNVLDYVIVPTSHVVKKYKADCMRFTDVTCLRLQFKRCRTASAIAEFISEGCQQKNGTSRRSTRTTNTGRAASTKLRQSSQSLATSRSK
jgi:DNA invertase Pin-like site-specific DNA recombinase